MNYHAFLILYIIILMFVVFVHLQDSVEYKAYQVRCDLIELKHAANKIMAGKDFKDKFYEIKFYN